MRARSSFLVLAIALSVSIAGVASAQDDRARARTEFERGVAAYGASDYQTALDAFQEAYRLAPHPSVRVNIANCYERLGRPIEALFHFEHFLSEAERPAAAQRREIQEAIRRLEAQVGHIQLQITPDGAAVTIDGGDTRRTPILEPVRVTAGQHTVEIRMDGYTSERQTVAVQGGQTVRVAVRLQRPTVAAAGGTGTTGASGTGGAATTGTTGTSGSAGTGTSGTTAATGATASTSTGATTSTTSGTSSEGAGSLASATTSTTSTTTTTTGGGETGGGSEIEQPSSGGGFVLAVPTIIAGAVTVAAAIGAGITGGLALSANSDFEQQVAIYEDPASTPDVRQQAQRDGEAAASDARTLAVVSDVLLVTTIVGAGATVFFLITTQDGGMLGASGERETASRDGLRLVAVPVVTGDLVGATVAGTF